MDELTNYTKLLEPFKEFLGKVIGYPLEEVGGIIGDSIRYLRTKNLINLFKKAKTLLEINKINPQKINLKILSPLLEGASLEEDENLSEKWAALLINAADSVTAKDVKPAFIEILKTLTRIEAKILDDLYIYTQEHRGPVKMEYLINKFGLVKDDYEIIIENLIRLNLCESPSSGGTTWNTISIFRDNKEIILTALGKAFITACKK